MTVSLICTILTILIECILSKQPNIVMIIIDDFGWADTGYRYNSDFKLENIGYLHSIAVDLTNYYIHRVCTPTRSSFMNGRYSWQNGAQKVFTPQTLQHLPFINDVNTKILPQYLKQNNYYTYGVGKWHLVTYYIYDCYLQIYTYIDIHIHTNCRAMQHII